MDTTLYLSYLQIKTLRGDKLTAVDLPHGHSGNQNTEAGTKFCGLNIQIHFFEWKYSNFTEFFNADFNVY